LIGILIGILNLGSTVLRFLPFLFLIVPLTEIAVFIVVGRMIGILPTIALVIVTAIAGAALLRHQGFGLAMRLKDELDAGRVPGRQLAHGALMIAVGVLLLTPGFVTDTIGLLLFVPAVRERIFNRIAAMADGTAWQASGRHGPRPDDEYQNHGQARRGDGVVDLDPADYRDLDAPPRRTEPPAG
jgi:UPF0716 protein FxsA